MKDVNVVCLSGRLTRDPELRATANGNSVCNMSIAVNENYKSGDEWKERAHFFDVTVWGKQGENAAKYLAKGSQLTIQGRLQQRSWETDDGSKRSKTEVSADVLIFPPRPAADSGPRTDAGQDGLDFGDDDLPF